MCGTQRLRRFRKPNQPGKEDEIQPGTELTIDGRRFAIDSINKEFGSVSLRDITFANATGFPIFRSEHIETVRELLSQQSATREKITIEPDSPEAPEWVRERGETVSITREGDTVTIDGDGEGEKSYVEMDVDLPEPLQPAWEKADGVALKSVYIDLTPEKPKQPKLDFRITDDAISGMAEPRPNTV